MTKLKFSKYFFLLLTCILCFISSFMNAQNFKILPQSSTLNIYGTSSLHDWEIKVTLIDGELKFDDSKMISSLIVTIPVHSLKSGKRAMDKRTYASLDDKKNPNIIFQLTESSPIKINDNYIEVTLTGNLTLAGETKKISFKSTGEITESGNYRIKGSVPLKMTDFKINPPTTLLGTMKTGNDVVLKFDTIWQAGL
jgi:polyisoprenoid-binding protein YceI